MAGRIEGKIALITGAARGQGRAFAIRLAEEGADIIAADVCEDMPGRNYKGGTSDELAETVRLVRKAGRHAKAVQADVRDYPALKEAIDAGAAELGGLDIVCANAGIGSRQYMAHDIPEEEWQLMLGVNLTGVWHTCKAAVPHVIAGGRGGSVVINSSVTGLRAYANISHYVSAKHAGIGLMRSLAIELGPHDIRVNAILPTQVNTPMIMNRNSWNLFRPDLEEPTKDDFAAASQRTGVLPRPWVEPEDISNALLFLVSDEARCITGVALPVDNGALVK
ncbi:mycofactocin-coupled SDR family oxidoreductase [Streptomyces sp. NPDC054962]